MKNGAACLMLLIVPLECLSYVLQLNLQYIVFRIKAMDADAKTYTFKSESSSQSHQYNTIYFQPINSPTFKGSQRAQSLPLNHNYKTTTKIQSSGSAPTNSRRRRNRIFEQTRFSSQDESLSAGKRKRNSIFGQTNHVNGGQTDKVSFKQKPQIDSILQQQLKSPFQCKQLIEKKLMERLNNGGFRMDTHIKQKVAMKQREIGYLQMEIERFKRCEAINKQNQDLSRKLASKLKERVNQSFYQKAIKQPAEAETPIHSLKQIKFATAAESPQQQTPIKTVSNQPSHTTPLKTIPQNEENQLYTQARTQHLPTEPAVQFKTTTKKKNHRERRSPPKMAEKDPIYMEIKQKLNEHPIGLVRSINDIPLNMRLQEMNRHLESSFNAYARRAYSRPQSQSSKKTKRVDQSLKKSHYYIMMQ